MNSDNVQVHGAADSEILRAKRSWKKPSIEIVALKTAEAGSNRGQRDFSGCHANACRS